MRPMPSMPNTSRFTVIVSAVMVATIMVMTSLLLWQLRGQELRHAEGETVSLSHIIVEQTTRSLQSVDLTLDVALDRLAQAERLGVSFGEVAIHAMLRSRVEAMPQLRSMFIIGADGTIASSALSHPAPKVSVQDRDYFTSVRDRPGLDRYVSAPLINRVDGTRTFFISRRIRNSKRDFVGVIVASLDIPYIESLYESIKLDSISPIALYMDDGTLVARAPPDESLTPGKAALPPLERGGEGLARFKTVRTEGEDAGITTYRRVGGVPMVLGIGNSDRAALEGWRGSVRMIVAAAMVNILLVLTVMAVLLRRQRREALLAAAAQESDDQLRAMVESAMDAIITIDSERRIIVFNPAAQSMFGYNAEEVRGTSLDRLLPERFRMAHERNIGAFRHSGVMARMKKARMEIVGLRADGREFPLESTIAQVTIGGQTLFTAILRDISERRRAEDELRESNLQLRELATSLQTVREEERTSIARELHDELGQQLLRLRMDLDWLAGRLKDLAPALHEKADAMKHFIAGTVDALRHVTTRLRPPLLDDLGLSEAIRWQLDEFSKRTGIEVEADIAIDDLALEEVVAINTFRILQEALTNVARHAAATQVKVSLARMEEGLALQIRDNGRGSERRDKPELGHGLVGIRERTLLLGGRMEIASAAGEGFAIMVSIPLRAAETAGEQK